MTGEIYYYEALTGNGPFPGQAVEATSPVEQSDFYPSLPQTSFETHAELGKPPFSAEEEHGLALLVQDGLTYQRMLPDIEGQLATAAQGEMPDWLPESHRIARLAIREGEKAKQELIGGNLDLAQKLALVSMGILPAGERAALAKRWPAPRQKVVDRLPWLSSESTNLWSPYASTEDRISVANCGLVRAAQKFTPGTSHKGKLMPFSELASQVIKEELTNYVLGDERPHYDTASHAVSLETLHYEGAADDEADYTTPVLPAKEVIPEQHPYDPSHAAIKSVLADKVREALSKVLSERYALAVMLRFGFYPDHPEPTFAEIGRIMGVKAARAQGICQSAMSKLSNSDRVQALEDIFRAARGSEGQQPLRAGDSVKTAQAAGQSTIRLVVEA